MNVDLACGAMRLTVDVPWQTVACALFAWAMSFTWLLWTCRRQG